MDPTDPTDPTMSASPPPPRAAAVLLQPSSLVCLQSFTGAVPDFSFVGAATPLAPDDGMGMPGMSAPAPDGTIHVIPQQATGAPAIAGMATYLHPFPISQGTASGGGGGGCTSLAWSTSFVFSLAEGDYSYMTGAPQTGEGMVFFLNPAADLLGPSGEFMGWGFAGNSAGLATPTGPSFAVEFDLNVNQDAAASDLGGFASQVGVNFNYNMRSTAQVGTDATLRLASPSVRYAWIDYMPPWDGDPGYVTVRVSDGPTKPTAATLTVNVPDGFFCSYPALGSSSGPAVLAGFAAATGPDVSTAATLKSWCFATGLSAE
eukprot:jgi/Mesen1/118/ME1125023C07669